MPRTISLTFQVPDFNDEEAIQYILNSKQHELLDLPDVNNLISKGWIIEYDQQNTT